MNAKQLYIHNGSVYQKVNAFVCGNCNMSNRTMEGAEDCCRCDHCKEKPTAKNSFLCLDCRKVWQDENNKKQGEKEKAALDAAIETTEFEYIWYNDRMYSDIEQLLEDLATDDEDRTRKVRIEYDENERHNKPCPYNSEVMCVQMPMGEEIDRCNCDACVTCETKLEAENGKENGN